MMYPTGLRTSFRFALILTLGLPALGMLWSCRQCKAQGVYLTTTCEVESSSNLQASDSYRTPNFGENQLTDSHTINLSATGGTVTGFASGALGLLQANFTTSASGLYGFEPVNTAAATLSPDYGDALTLVTTTLPAGTPEQYNLTATLAYTATVSSYGVAVPSSRADLFILPTIEANLSGTKGAALPLFGSTNPAPGTYSQTLNFQAGQTIIFIADLYSEAIVNSGSSLANFAMVNSSLSFTLTPITPGVTYTSALAEANLPEPSMGGVLALVAAAMLLARPRRHVPIFPQTP